jgi:hypothetical protein
LAEESKPPSVSAAFSWVRVRTFVAYGCLRSHTNLAPLARTRSTDAVAGLPSRRLAPVRFRRSTVPFPSILCGLASSPHGSVRLLHRSREDVSCLFESRPFRNLRLREVTCPAVGGLSSLRRHGCRSSSAFRYTSLRRIPFAERAVNKTWLSVKRVYAYANRTWCIMHVGGELIAERIYL